MLAGAANIQILSSAKDLKEFWSNVGLLVCWLFPESVFLEKWGKKKRKAQKQPTNQQIYIYILISLTGTTFLSVGLQPTNSQQTNIRGGHGRLPVAW
jgi:hypothetical protein